MESEPLEPCPVCGAKILQSVVPMYDDGSDASTASCFNGKCLYRVRREDHNTLARHAAIGALVERLIPESGRNLTIHRSEPGFGVFRTGRLGRGPTLLDALRALDKEVSGDD